MEALCRNCGQSSGAHDDERCKWVWPGRRGEEQLATQDTPLIKEPLDIEADNHTLRNELQNAKNRIWHLNNVLESSRAVVERQRLQLEEYKNNPMLYMSGRVIRPDATRAELIDQLSQKDVTGPRLTVIVGSSK